MLTPSDKELDRLSREAAEQYEPDEYISSWEKLEARLDADLGKTPVPPTRRFGRGPIGYLALILLLTGGSYLLLKQDRKIHSSASDSKINNESVTKKADAKAEVNPNNSKPSQPDAAKINVEKNSASNPNQVALPKADNNKPASGSPKVDAVQLKTGLHTDKNNNKAIGDQDNSTVTKSNTKAAMKDPGGNSSTGKYTKPEAGNAKAGLVIPGIVVTSVNVQSKNPAALGKNTGNGHDGAIPSGSNPTGIVASADPLAAGSTLNSSTVQTEKEPSAAMLPGIESVSSHPPVVDGSLNVNQLSAANTVSTLSGPLSNKSAGKSRSLHLNRPLTIGIMYAPDITSVKGVAPDQLSSNLGITLGYHLTDRLSINTGFISTKKYYSASGKDFKGSPPPYTYIDFVKGDCNMYEIPLTLRYDFDAGSKTKFFVNGGLSTYLMTHESYIYYGTTRDAMGRWSNYTTPAIPKDSNQHYPFSVITLSAGVEQRIGKSLSLQVEPFIKIPLTGMGVGSLNLSSYGLSFSLRYSPLLGKSRR